MTIGLVGQYPIKSCQNISGLKWKSKSRRTPATHWRQTGLNRTVMREPKRERFKVAF